jgi:hypothetical protein
MLHEEGQEMGKRLRFSRYSLLIASAVLTLSLPAAPANAQAKLVKLWDLATGRLRALDGHSPILIQGPTTPGVESFRQVAEEFIAAAAAGDMAKMTRMLSPDIVTKTGREAVERYLADNVLPFFAQFKEIGRSTTITRTADMPGFVFYMYMVSKDDQLRPFVIFVIEENSAKVVANILPDKFVEGRHCAFEAGRWKCPDFR